MKRTEKIAISILTGLCLGFLIAAATSCVSKHPKCAAYDKCGTYTNKFGHLNQKK